MIKLIRELRHKYLRSLKPLWLILGKIYRFFAPIFRFKCDQYINKYGPFKFDSVFLFSNYSEFGGGHNPGFEHLIKNLKYADTFFDVGAHIGLVSIPAAINMKIGSKIVAFEPFGKNFLHLKNHINNNKLHDKVFLNDNLVGERTCKRSFFISKNESPINSISKVHQIENYKEVKLNQITLDDYCNETGIIPQIIKIDVEGAEINVLKGSRKIIEKYKPLIYLSIHPIHIKALGQDLNDLKNIIKKFNYRIEDFEGEKITDYKMSEYLMIPKDKRKRTLK
tara:strand:+ start:507 stop:1346 length:840 start_codon:yes stop_codon:yes gene_type:complete